MQFTVDGTALTLKFSHCTVAGWTGRNKAAIQHHIDELAAIGVTPPSSVPLYYRVASGILTGENRIEVVGPGTSGEIEPFLVAHDGTMYIGLASDHTDRDLEAHSVALSKQACLKPVAATLWRFDEVAGHLDQLEMRSWIREGNSDEWVLYQDGLVAAIRPLSDLIDGSKFVAAATDGKAAGMLCGTLGVVSGGVRPARAFKMELRDPVLNRVIAHEYDIIELPVIS
ncbi:DUF2848 domain-containing protein [Thalassospira sp.]|uniref:DUF2848 domain-containing protein n=1 Tax=Thalassospira sp. TaxID=1912094 RepID=UPI0027337DE5|nr:DUF2848 domain-containing protein [Thalassospira sp.]MDP2697355.1 DUF2848 domain-containing protein [Thalassospira sp.]